MGWWYCFRQQFNVRAQAISCTWNDPQDVKILCTRFYYLFIINLSINVLTNYVNDMGTIQTILEIYILFRKP